MVQDVRSEGWIEFTDRLGRIIYNTKNFKTHIQAHKEVMIRDIQEALLQTIIDEEPCAFDGNIIIDRRLHKKGVCALVEDPIPCDSSLLFAYRAGRDFPTRMSKKEPEVETNMLRVVVRPPRDTMNGRYEVRTAYWVRDAQVGIEPFDPTIDPTTRIGQCRLQRAIERWSTYAISLPYLERKRGIQDSSFTATWSKLLRGFGYPCPPVLRTLPPKNNVQLSCA